MNEELFHGGLNVPDIPHLKECLDRLATEYGSAFLDTDPVSLLHTYGDPGDAEVVGLVTACLAYGGAAQIIGSARDALERLGPAPARTVGGMDHDTARRLFRGFRHRWTTGEEMAALVTGIGCVIARHGSLGELVREIDGPDDPDITGLLTRFTGRIRSYMPAPARSRRGGSGYLLPSPAGGSACKRTALYFRWMVRGPDGIDLGLWRWISPARLVIPLDRHIAHMARRLDLTTRRTPDWRMATAITDMLRRLDPDDPLRYDFALVRPGITGVCAADGSGCAECAVASICREAP
jgi:uncharacterized protein (TIGR02757 family)